MGNSFYVQLAPYLLLEYTYGDSSTTYMANQVKVSKIKNNHFKGQIQFLNGFGSQNITKNVLNTSAVKIANSRWAYLNTDVPTPYISIDSDIIYTDLSSIITTSVLYDRVRVHILSGYRLDDIDGLIVQVYVKEAQTSLHSILANRVYLNSDDTDTLNHKPILLGDRMYDRFIEVYVPSVKSVNQDFYSNPLNTSSIGYQYSSDNRGFLYNTGIYVKVYEIHSSEIKGGNLFFNTGNEFVVTVNQEDIYSALSAVIEEAPDGDYFRYYPTYGGNFIEDFIVDLNSKGDYVLINDIEVWEQIGTENISTFSFSQLQVSGFDKPIEWRPIIKYADVAVAFSIDYTVRLYNRQNGFQIIRRASTTCFNPKKYGKELKRINLASQSYPFKVYNKVVSGPNITFAKQDYNTNFKTVYVPVFYDSRKIVVQTKSLITPFEDNDTVSEIYFGQGDARIYLSDFDSYQKFNIYRVDKKTNALMKMDLTKGNISIVFKDKNNKKIAIPLDPSIPQNSRALGELVFHIPGDLKRRVLYDSLPKNFNIVIESEGTSPTVIYTGTVVGDEKISEEPARVSQISSQASSLTSILSSSSTTVPSVLNSSSLTVKPDTSSTIQSTSLLTDLIKENSSSISTKDKQQVLQPHIPGFSNDKNAISIKLGVKPKVKVSDKTIEQKLAKSDGISIKTSVNDTK